MNFINFILIITLSAIVSCNNYPSLTAPLYGSDLLSRRGRFTLVLIGILSGLLIEGWKLSKFTEAVFITQTSLIEIGFIFTIFLFLILTLFGIPISFSHVLCLFLIGSAFSLSLCINISYVTLLIVSWFISPFISIVISYVTCALIDRKLIKINIWKRAQIIKLLLIISSLYASYVFGSNTLGLLIAIISQSNQFLSFDLFIVMAGTLVGVILCRESFIRRVGKDLCELGYSTALGAQLGSAIVVELFTQLSIPISITQTIVSGIVGSTLAKKVKIINWRNYLIVASQWAISPILGLLFGLYSQSLTRLLLGV